MRGTSFKILNDDRHFKTIMTAATRYGPENSPNNVLDARLSPDYDFNTPTPLQPRVLEYEDVEDYNDDIRALREAEAERGVDLGF